MEIVLVRHGETGGNVAKRHQSDATPLTPRGRAQVAATAQTIATQFKPTHIVSSNVLRAVESASIISAACDIIPDTNVVFREIVRPAKLHGHFHKSVFSMFFYFLWYVGLTHPDKDQGESYAQLRDRIKAAQKILETYPSDARVVVVSHSVFINFFLVHLCNQKPLKPWQVPAVFLSILRIPNASMVHLTCQPDLPEHTCRWRRTELT